MLSKTEYEDLSFLSERVGRCMNSVPVLRRLSNLEAKGFITFAPFDGEAALTDDGRSAIAEYEKSAQA